MDGGLTAVIAVASVASALVSGYAAYSSSQAQAELGQQQARTNMINAQLQAEMSRTQRAALATQGQQAALETVEQQNERRRRLEMGEGSNRAMAAFAGFDAENSGSYQSLAAENRRVAEADLQAIRLMGGARAMQIQGQQMGAAAQEVGARSRATMTDMEGDSYATMGRYAWVAPTGRLLGQSMSMYKAYA